MSIKNKLEDYNLAVNEITVEFIKYYFAMECVLFQKKFTFSNLGDEFCAGDGSDDGETCHGHWVNGKIGGVLVVNEEYFLDFDRIKEAVELIEELNFPHLDKFFDYYDLELELYDQNQKPDINFRNFMKYGQITK